MFVIWQRYDFINWFGFRLLNTYNKQLKKLKTESMTKSITKPLNSNSDVRPSH